MEFMHSLPQGFFAFQAQGPAPGRARGWVAERAVSGHEGAGASECVRRRECIMVGWRGHAFLQTVQNGTRCVPGIAVLPTRVRGQATHQCGGVGRSACITTPNLRTTTDRANSPRPSHTAIGDRMSVLESYV